MKLKELLSIGLLLIGSITLQAQEGLSSYAISGTSVNFGTNWAIIPGESAQQMNNSQGIPVAPTPVVNYIQVRNSLSTGDTLQSYYSTNQTPLALKGDSLGNTLTNQVPWPAGTNGVNAPCWCVIHHVPLTNYVFFTNVIYGQTNVITRPATTTIPVQVADEAIYLTGFAGNAINIITNTINTVTNAAGLITTNMFTATNALLAFATAPLLAVNPNDELYFESPGPSITVPGQALTTEFPSTGTVFLSGQRRKPFLLTLTSGAATANTNSIDTVNATFVP